MSYSVSIAVKVEGIDYYVQLCDLGNITWNARELIFHSSGWNIENEQPNGDIIPWIRKIRKGIHELENHPQEYKKYEAKNGWGTVICTLNFYRECIKNAEEWLYDNEYNEKLREAAIIYVG